MQPGHRLAEHIGPAAPLVADNLRPLDADQRRDVAHPPQALRLLVGDELAVGKDLEVAIRMRFEQLEELRMHERLAADDAEEDVAHLLRFAHELVKRLRRHRLHLRRHIDPAALAAQIARVDDTDVEEWRKDLPALEPPLVPLYAKCALHAHVPGELPQQTLIRFEQHALGHLEEHGDSRWAICEAVLSYTTVRGKRLV